MHWVALTHHVACQLCLFGPDGGGNPPPPSDPVKSSGDAALGAAAVIGAIWVAIKAIGGGKNSSKK